MLFACCIPVKGAVRSIVCDLQRSDYMFISNDLCDMLSNGSFLSQQDVDEIPGRSNDSELLDQLQLLEEKEFCFRCSEEESRLFAQIPLNWNTSKSVTNAIIDSDCDSKHPFSFIFSQLAKLGCQAVQLRFFDPVSILDLEVVLSTAQKNRFTDIELIVADMESSNVLLGRTWSQQFPALTKVIFHSASSNRLLANERGEVPIYQITNRITSAEHCGFIHPDGFIIGREMFSEAQNHNTCLSGKLSIDMQGNIKNCPAMNYSFGKVNEANFDDILRMKEFKRSWNMTKNKISVCQDCEFRYVCTDCRAHVIDETDPYSKPAKCSYDPYATSWLKASTENLK